MSLGNSPSTVTVDPTPPQLKPLQQLLVQLMQARLGGKGQSSVPTYGSNLPNIQQQLYGQDPRTPTRTVGTGTGNGAGTTIGPGSHGPAHPVPTQPYPVPTMTQALGMLGPTVNPLLASAGQFNVPPTIYMDQLSGMTRGGPTGIQQGTAGAGPFMNVPTLGQMISGSSLLRSFRPQY